MKYIVLHIRQRIITGIIYSGLLIIGLSAYKNSWAQAVNEHQVKAVFLYNFSKFIEWPAESFKSADAPFVIGVLGPDPFGSFLDQTVRGENISGHPIVIKRFRRISEVHNCHILFINLPDKVRESIATARNKHMLTVCNAPRFTALGGMIRFYTESDMVKLEINLAAVKAAGLIISSKLLRVAKIYEGS